MTGAVTGTAAGTPAPGTGHPVGTIERWLAERVGEYVLRPPEEIDPTAAIAGYGMDSVYNLSLCGDIESEFGLEVDPTLVWEHPTIEAIAAHLRARMAG
ncbi:acyl carrier protein [Bailinhaonella thermotolerans]|uniref:Acyl carrier protein n=2 Tax=Bailinhaonella thermotolerans TaxID=1070861 RepID=A0A3A4A206_9ACTN|nr:acyl carrier protein [Bailinhaonella thermotolerans]